MKRRRLYEGDPPDPQRRAKNLRVKYGLTPEQFAERLAAQGGRCAICDTAEPGGTYNVFHVDHDHACCPKQHTCGQCLRGLLCNACNRGLGGFSDNAETLRNAAAYLDKWTLDRVV